MKVYLCLPRGVIKSQASKQDRTFDPLDHDPLTHCVMLTHCLTDPLDRGAMGQ